MPTLVRRLRRKKRSQSVHPINLSRFKILHDSMGRTMAYPPDKIEDFPNEIMRNAQFFGDQELLFLMSIYSPDVARVRTDEYSGVVLPGAKWREWTGLPIVDKWAAIISLRLKGLQVFNEVWPDYGDGDDEVYFFEIDTFLAWKEDVASGKERLLGPEGALLARLSRQRG